MRIATREEIRAIEARTMGTGAVAGRAIAVRLVTDARLGRGSRVAVVCGPGNNGADGRVIAAELRDRFHCRSSLIDAAAFESVTANLARADVIVDAVFGVGLDRELTGRWRSCIEAIRDAGRPVAAVDLPSGLDANRGIIHGAAVRARWTYACGLAKPGSFLHDGPSLCGQVRVIDRGFPAAIVSEEARSVRLVGPRSARRLWPALATTQNKVNFGSLLVIAGSKGTEGAAILASSAGARVGAGYVTLGTPNPLPFDRRPADFLTASWPDLLRGDFGRANAVVIGPGLGVNGETAAILGRLRQTPLPVVIDADALTVCASERSWPLPANWILTPHAGELSRFLPGWSARAIEADRLAAAQAASRLTGAIILLKGLHTVVAHGGRSYIVHAGNAALAKAGTGDVLAGFIGGLLAQNFAPETAAVLGAYVHGHLADRWVSERRGRRTLLASDLPGLFADLVRSGEWR